MRALPRGWRRQVDLAPMTTLQVGGAAEYFTEPANTDELVDTLAIARREGIPVTVLGGGSNVLIADAGLAGLVIRQRGASIEPMDRGRVCVSAGTEWDALVRWAVERGLGGLECLSGIPGLVGAAPIQNIGAYGREVAEVLRSVAVVDRSSGAVVEMEADACGFGYRTSLFKTDAREHFVITGITLELEARAHGEVRYRDLVAVFPDGTAPIAEIRAAVLRIRREKSMVWDKRDPNHRSAGSFFVNPIVPVDVADMIDEAAGAAAPRFPTADGSVKVPAAWLIEHAGFNKGFIRGRAGISTAHALALINRGGARSEEIVELAGTIQREVSVRFGVTLVPEPVHLGFTGTGRAEVNTESPTVPPSDRPGRG